VVITIIKKLMKDQKGAAGIDTYFNLAIVMMFLVIFMVAMTGMMVIFDSRSDLQNVAEFIGQQYRDEGCISYETKNLVTQMASAQKMDISKISITGEDSTPLQYRSSKIIFITYEMQVPVFPQVKIAQSITLPIPIVSQFVPSPLLNKNFTCEAM
jgi:hypothetical protein